MSSISIIVLACPAGATAWRAEQPKARTTESRRRTRRARLASGPPRRRHVDEPFAAGLDGSHPITLQAKVRRQGDSFR
jgi:hypothetical protein